MKQENRKTGGIGEKMAEEFLVKKGFKILERNWGNKWGEIDLIAEKPQPALRAPSPSQGRADPVIVFVEVKTKIGEDWGSPEEMVNRTKLAKIQRMGEVYLLDKNAPCRIDVVAVVLACNGEIKRISHYENVY